LSRSYRRPMSAVALAYVALPRQGGNVIKRSSNVS
jgi:hypothetical protein